MRWSGRNQARGVHFYERGNMKSGCSYKQIITIFIMPIDFTRRENKSEPVRYILRRNDYCSGLAYLLTDRTRQNVH